MVGINKNYCSCHNNSAMSNKKKATEAASSVVDDHQEIHHPLDYSFKAVSRFEDLLEERPRVRGKQPAASVPEDELSADGSGQCVELEKSHSATLKANNNLLGEWDGFTDTLHKLFYKPTQLSWIDLSFNDLRCIDSALVALPGLTMLYLHGNNIDTIAEVDKLSALLKLKSLALHGNPIEMGPGYRQHVLSHIPQLQTFDFSGVTKADRATASTWKTLIAPKTHSKRKT